MSKQTLALIAILAVLSSVLVVLALTPKTTPPAATTVKTEATPTVKAPMAEAVLSMTPNPLVLTVGSVIPSTISVVIDSGSHDITAAQLELSYDPKMLTITDIAPGDFIENPLVLLKNIGDADGRVTFAFGIQPTGTGKKGKGTIAKITVVGKGAGGQSTNLTLLPKTLITATGVEKSVLKSATGTSVLFTVQTQAAPTTAPTTP
jgi:hypothetical protein